MDGIRALRRGMLLLSPLDAASYVDICVLTSSRVCSRIYPKRTTIVSKKSIQYTPLGPFMSMSGAVFINRGNNASALRSLAAAGETVKSQRLSLWVYPEGTRRSGEDDALLPFKKGAFHLAVQGGLPIIPIVTENYWRIYHKGIFGGGTIKVRGTIISLSVEAHDLFLLLLPAALLVFTCSGRVGKLELFMRLAFFEVDVPTLCLLMLLVLFLFSATTCLHHGADQRRCR